jgi:unsaturated pyranuronate lyase
MKMFAHAGQEPPFVTPDGAQRRVPSYGGNLMVVQFTFDVGAASWLYSHPHGQVGYVVSGEIDVNVEGHEPVRLQADGTYVGTATASCTLRTMAGKSICISSGHRQDQIPNIKVGPCRHAGDGVRNGILTV